MKSARAGFLATSFALVLAPASGCHGAPKPEFAAESQALALKTGFPADGNIPAVYTCDGANTSPSLSWSEPPANTKSFALILDDPDAPGGTFVHWVIFNLPLSTRTLPAAVPKQSELPGGARQGRNDFGEVGYGGPCPPGHAPHHYRFVLYAVDTPLNLPPGATRQQVEDALKGHVVARGRVISAYSR